MDINYRAVHRDRAWRKASFSTWQKAVDGPDGAKNLLRRRGRVGKKWEQYGPVDAVFVWRDDAETDGRGYRLKPGSASEIEEISIPAQELNDFDGQGGCPTIRIESYFAEALPSPEAVPATRARRTTQPQFMLFLNGVFESVLEEILASQSEQPGLISLLQPHSTRKISKLASTNPTPQSPLTLYMSTTDGLAGVSYRAEIVQWEDKTEIDSGRLEALNRHIEQNQPSEKEIFLETDSGAAYANLVSIRVLKKLKAPFHVSTMIKLSDGAAYQPRTQAGGWSYVRPLPDWLGSSNQTMLGEINEALESAITASTDDSKAERDRRLETAERKPTEIIAVTRVFRRNADVVVAVRDRANGICEICDQPAPFVTREGRPYLEVHHKVMLANGGEDTVDNAIALCPNCHRNMHYGA